MVLKGLNLVPFGTDPGNNRKKTIGDRPRFKSNSVGLVESLTETSPIASPGNVRVTSYSYYPTGLIQTLITADGITLNYEYDLANNLTAVTEGRGITATLTYDELERVETKTYPNSIAGKIEDANNWGQTMFYETAQVLRYAKNRTIGKEQ